MSTDTPAHPAQVTYFCSTGDARCIQRQGSPVQEARSDVIVHLLLITSLITDRTDRVTGMGWWRPAQAREGPCICTCRYTFSLVWRDWPALSNRFLFAWGFSTALMMQYLCSLAVCKGGHPVRRAPLARNLFLLILKISGGPKRLAMLC
jgi:hypothetical protein